MDANTAQWIQTGVIALLTAVVAAVITLRKERAEALRTSRGDTFVEMKSAIDIAREDAMLARKYYDEQRNLLSARIDTLSKEHMDCLQRSAKFEAMVIDLQKEVEELKQRIAEMPNNRRH